MIRTHIIPLLPIKTFNIAPTTLAQKCHRMATEKAAISYLHWLL